MMITLVLAGAALAGPPAGLRPVVAPADAPAQYRRYLEAEGAEPADSLACDVLWAGHALLCFRVWEGKRRRWVTAADVEAWGVTVPHLTAAVRARAASHLGGLEQRPIVDMSAHWWLLADGDGWAAAGVLDPAALETKVGVPLRVAVPAEGVLVAWQASSPEVDHVMAVGVRELYDAQPAAVSPMIFTWTGRDWAPFGKASPVEAETPSEAGAEGAAGDAATGGADAAAREDDADR